MLLYGKLSPKDGMIHKFSFNPYRPHRDIGVPSISQYKHAFLTVSVFSG